MPLGDQVGGLWGDSPLKNLNTSDFDEIWTIYVNLHKKNYRAHQNSLGAHVMEKFKQGGFVGRSPQNSIIFR